MYKSTWVKTQSNSTVMASFCLLLSCWFYLTLAANCVRLQDFFPYGVDVGDARIRRSDDSSSPPLTFPAPFPFYDELANTVYVSNNGIISLGTVVGGFSPSPFPISDNSRIIAPFWADVDTSSVGTVWYRFAEDVISKKKLQTVLLQDRTLFPEIDLSRFDSLYLFIVTWDTVGYYDQHSDKNNTFQCILSTDGRISFVLFYYLEEGLNWSTGDASGGVGGLGGTPAQVGFNAGDGARYIVLPGSQTSDVLEFDDKIGNTGVKGNWVFQVDTTVIRDPSTCGTSALELIPNFGNMLGGTAVIVRGPCFDPLASTECLFGVKRIAATYVDQKQAICISPALNDSGAVQFMITSTNASNTTFNHGHVPFYSLSFLSSHDLDVTTSDLVLRPGDVVSLNWSPSYTFKQLLGKQNCNKYMKVSMFRLSNILKWMQVFSFKENTSSSNSTKFTLPRTFPHVESELLIPVVFGVTTGIKDCGSSNYLHVEGRLTQWSRPFYLQVSSLHYSQCAQWIQNSSSVPPHYFTQLFSCPCNKRLAELHTGLIQQSNIDGSFLIDEEYTCFYPSIVNFPHTAASQCCYGRNDRLAVDFGFTDLFSPRTRGISISRNRAFLEHFKHDIIPYVLCCKIDISLCLSFIRHRVLKYPMLSYLTQQCSPTVKLPAMVYGDPHFLTFDGSMYTFNGKGEFILAESNHGEYRIEARMTEIPTADRHPALATAITALVIKQEGFAAIQLEVSRRGIDILINGILITLQENRELMLSYATVMRAESGIIYVAFSSGVILQIMEQFNIIFYVLVSIPQDHHVTGLLGLFNGISSDDLLPRGREVSLPNDSSQQAIHEGFGLTWINDNPDDSIFTYHDGESWDQFFDPGFSATFVPFFYSPLLLSDAEQECESDAQCFFDVAATGNLEFGRETKSINNILRSVSFLMVNCSIPCEHGVCTGEDVCSCFEGFTGYRCEIEVPDVACSEAICLNGGSCSKVGRSHVCDCLSAFSGLLCEIVESLQLDYTISVDRRDILWLGFETSRDLQNVVCTFYEENRQNCFSPQLFDVSTLLPGNYNLRITVIDIYNISFEKQLIYARQPLEIHFVNSSPRVTRNQLAAEFVVNRPVLSVTCLIKGQAPLIDASSLWVRFNDLPGGKHTIRIQAVANNKERVILRRRIDIGDDPSFCVVNLINDGVTVHGRNVTIQFYRSGPVRSFLCILDRSTTQQCGSLYRLYNLMPGLHHLQIIPQGCRRSYRKLTTTFTIL